MHDSERLLIERECQRLVTRYCHYVDHGDAAKIAELFSEDGVWTGPGVRMQGRGQLAQGFGLRQANTKRMSCHVCNNLLVDIVDEHHAEGTVYLRAGASKIARSW